MSPQLTVLKLYDALGREVGTLVNEKKPVSEGILNAFKTAQKDFIRKNPGSFLSHHIMSNIINDLSVNEYDSILLAMDPMVAKSSVMMELKARFSILRVTALGQKAPDFTLNDVDGKPVSLASKIGPKLLLLDFWAAWFGPCRRENPFVVQTYNEFHDKGFDEPVESRLAQVAGAGQGRAQ